MVTVFGHTLYLYRRSQFSDMLRSINDNHQLDIHTEAHRNQNNAEDFSLMNLLPYLINVSSRMRVATVYI
jgi:hypothetical protein